MGKKKLLEKPFAHRGLYNNKDIPENSMLAFEKAINENYPIELDVRLTLDHKVIVFHDSNLHRMTDIQKNVSDLTLLEIKKIKLNYIGIFIPTIEEVLELTNGKVALLIEIKNKNTVGLIEKKVMESLKGYKGYFAIQSFNPLSCYWVKRNYPGIDAGQLSTNYKNYDVPFYKKFILQNMLLNFIVKPDFISYDIDGLPNNIVKRMREKEIPILSWTVKTKEQLEKAKKYSDNFIFEDLFIINNLL